MKIYTKTGDQGETGLLGGIRVSKSSLAIAVCGSLDEANSFVGLARAVSLPQDVDELLGRIQNDLFDLGSRVAACMTDSNRAADFPSDRIVELESAIDQFDAELPPLTCFVLPGGSKAASLLHVARSVVRRSERELVGLKENVESDLSLELVFLNRLGDLLFILARLMNVRTECPETLWDVGRSSKK